MSGLFSSQLKKTHLFSKSFRNWLPLPDRNFDSSIYFDWHMLRHQLLNNHNNNNKVNTER